jgi:hypothetical protein
MKLDFPQLDDLSADMDLVYHKWSSSGVFRRLTRVYSLQTELQRPHLQIARGFILGGKVCIKMSELEY